MRGGHAGGAGASISRRDALRLGTLGSLGLSLPTLLAARAGASPPTASPRSFGKAKRAILFFHMGGPAHQETFDPKPEAPQEIRGEFKTLESAIAGYRMCEHLPLLAREVHRACIVRSVWHENQQHNQGSYQVLTGYRAPVLEDTVAALAVPKPDDQPAYGAALAHFRPSTRAVPRWVSLPREMTNGPFVYPGQGAGRLGRTYDPFWIVGDPSQPGFSVADLTLAKDVSPERVQRRGSLLQSLTSTREALETSGGPRALGVFQQRALDLLTGPETRHACRLELEDPKLRERYGMNLDGQSLLLARRLVEAGVGLVSVYSRTDSAWDTHGGHFAQMKNVLLPPDDRATSALLRDLDDRGLLDETLVIWAGDFGRTPKVNGGQGRDHWPHCFSILMAGGGLRRGLVLGKSDAEAAYPAERPVHISDIAATIYHCLGIDPGTLYTDLLGREIPLCSGTPVWELLEG